MAGKKEEVEPIEEETPVEAQTKTYTQEELEAQIAQAKEEEQNKYKGYQRVVSAREREIERLKMQVAQPTSHADELLLEELEARQTELGETNPRIAKLRAEIAKEKQREAQQAQIQWQERMTQEWRDKFDQRIKEAGLDPDNEKFDDFHDAFEDAQEDGRFGKAERKLNRILATKPKEKPVTDDKYAKLLDEEKRKWMEEQGLLVTNAGGPSASSPSVKEATAKFARGELTEEQARKAGVKFT